MSTVLNAFNMLGPRLSHLEYENAFSLDFIQPGIRSDLVLLFRNSSWKNPMLLGHPDLIEPESLDSIVRALHHRPPDDSIDNYATEFPFAPTFSSDGLMLPVDHPMRDN